MLRILFAVCLFWLSACNSSSTEPTSAAASAPDNSNAVEIAASPKVITEPACQLTLGWDPWEPYTYWTPSKQVSGLDIELIVSMANEVNCDIAFLQSDWMDLLNKLKSGEIDMLSGASYSESRSRFASFSNPYRQESFVLYVRQDEQSKFSESLSEILKAGKKVGLTEQYLYGDSVAELQDNPAYSEQLVYSAIGEMNYFNLLEYNVDAFIEDPFVGGYNIQRKGLKGQIAQLPWAIYSGDVHLMFSKQTVSADTVQQFNQALQTIRDRGEYQEILKRYLM